MFYALPVCCLLAPIIHPITATKELPIDLMDIGEKDVVSLPVNGFWKFMIEISIGVFSFADLPEISNTRSWFKPKIHKIYVLMTSLFSLGNGIRLT